MNTRKFIALLMILGTFILFQGCGGGSSSNSVDMEPDVEYEAAPGDIVTPTGENTRIEVRHVAEGDKKYVVLLEGSAELIR